MKFSPRTLRFREQSDWKSRVCFVWYACDDFFKDGWFVRTMLFVARFTSFFVVELGMGLVVFCTVVSAREVVPVLSVDSGFTYHFLNFLIVVVSFNILFNYVCACTFSSRIGRNPHRSVAPPLLGASSPIGTHAAELNAIPGPPPYKSREERGDDATTALLLPETVAASRTEAVTVLESLDDPRRPHSHRLAAKHGWSDTVSCLRLCGEERCATAAELAELDRIATEGDRYTARERRYKLLDEPRRFCVKCNRLKAPREHHCNVCGVCVPKMDHHCPWINSCVDAENLRYFFLFLFWLTIGTLLDSTILGYGFYRECHYERQVRSMKNNGTWNSAPRPRAPFGPRGTRMTTFPVILTIVITAIMFFCLCAFLYATTRMLVKNTTVIEECIIDHKRQLYRTTSFVYQNPYDLGPLRNLIEVFRTKDDPVVRDVIAHGLSGLLHACETADGRAGAPRRRGFRLQPGAWSWHGRVARVAKHVMLVSWLILPPTLRASGSDGVHFPTFFAEAAGGEEAEAMME